MPLAEPLPGSASADLRAGRPRTALLLLGGLLSLLAAELLALSLSFDGAALLERQVWWAAGIARARALPQLLLVACGVLLLLFPGPMRSAADRLAKASEAYPRRPLFVLAHLLCFGALFALSRIVFGDAAARSGFAAAWALAVAATLATWLACLAPLRFWAAEGARQKGLFAAAVIVGAAAWAAGLLSARLWGPLSEATFGVSSVLLRLFYAEVNAEPVSRLIEVDDFGVRIAQECSGLEGVGLVCVFLGAYLWFFRDRHKFPVSLLLLPLAAAVIWLVNAVRIAVLVVIGVEVSSNIALQGFHSQAGWIAFTLVALGVAGVAGRMPVFLKEAAAPAVGSSPAAAYLAPILAVLCTVMITGAVAGTLDWLYPLRIAAGALVLWRFRAFYRRFLVKPSGEAFAAGAAVFVLWMTLEPLQGSEDAPLRAGLAAMAPWTATLWLACRVAGSVLLIPVVEELAFRGYLIRRLRSADFESVPLAPVALAPALASSVAFGLLHGRWVAGTLAGLAYAWLLHRRGELSDPIAAHMTTNALIAAAVLLTGAWGLWM